ncbi:diguanylate cyclase [uncultured Ferrimonas sp.]|uniref:CHASE domain-containing protein n=1 Tax=uncultured Ferrimonas sp. TaxID=432640 RepID=UPI00261E3183|nr:diguanylate cyclase [uncultured Ferrimonas sp.]
MRRVALLWLSIIVSCGLFLMLAQRFYQAERDQLDRALNATVAQQADMLRWHMRSSFDVLQQLAVLFNAGEQVGIEQFRTVAEPILARHREVQALKWLPKVGHLARPERELAWQSTFPNFTFTEQQRSRIVPAKARKFYYPVLYVAPLATNETAFGFDWGSDPSRLSALMRARDKAELVVSEVRQQLENNTPYTMVSVMLPIYQSLPLTLEDRRQSLLGFVVGEFRLQEMVGATFYNHDRRLIDFRLVDDSDNGRTLYTLGQFDLSTDLPLMDRSLPNVGGRDWRLQALPQPHFYHEKMTVVPWVIGLAGCLGSILVVFTVYQLLRRNESIARLVQARTDELHDANQKLVQLSLTDGLTEIGNRRQFDYWLEQEWEAGKRSGKAMSLMLLDVDQFKAYNDNYGHRAGDRVLRQIAKALKRRLNRPRDLIARYGGEEFAVILPETTDNASVLAQALCEAVAEEQIPHEFGGGIGVVTVSIGVVTQVPEENSDARHMVELSDQALYRAKADGRNRFVAYGGRPKLLEGGRGDLVHSD